MANAIYPLYKAALRRGQVDETGVTFKAILIDTGNYTYSAAHEFLSDVPVGARVAEVTLASVTVDNSAVFDAADATFSAVTGNTSEAVIIYVDTGVEGTSRLQTFIDTATGLPATPNGGDITVTWNASGINQI